MFHEQLTAADCHHSHRARYLDIKGLVVGAILSTILVWHLLVLTLENIFAVHVLEIDQQLLAALLVVVLLLAQPCLRLLDVSLEVDQQLLAALLVIVLLHESSAFGFCGRGGILSGRQATS